MAKVNEDPTSRCCFAVICFFTLGVGIAVGIVVGKFVICENDNNDSIIVSTTVASVQEDSPNMDNIVETLLAGVDKDKIKENLRMLSEFPHIAGRDRNLELGQNISDYWQDIGLDEVRTKEYEVLLSYPDPNKPNVVTLLDKNNSPIYSSPLTEKVLNEAENKSGVVPPFLAYSKAGVVTGDLVYVNFGRVEDYAKLSAEPYRLNVKGKIVLARYGQIFRGDIVNIASQHGAIGVIIYSDPHEYDPDNTSLPYPKSWWLPPSGTQRGTIRVGDGDPLTPDYPSTNHAYRIQETEIADPPLPSIPAHAVDGEVATQIFSYLSGSEAPSEWRGNLNVKYSLGPTLKNGAKVKLDVSTSNQKKNITNIIGVIKGAVEPDRYVMIGNHRDAWVFGAMDPSGGTAIMMEMSRVLADTMKKTGWRPRRSIVFCSWDAEEYGLVGSTEFVQDYVKTLTNRAVAYINVDVAVEGGYRLRIGGSPLLYRTTLSATEKVMSPNSDKTPRSLYEEWLARDEMKDKDGKGMGRPVYSNLGSGSDFTYLRGLAGVPVMDFRYLHDQVGLHASDYPLYHSEYETFYAVEKFVDPSFKYHQAIGQLWLALATDLSEPAILPFNMSDYAWTLNRLRDGLADTAGEELKKILPNYDENLTLVIREFSEAADDFMSRTKDYMDPLAARQINDQMIQLERAFLDPNGLPDRRAYKHLIFAPSRHNSYAGASFPGLSDLLYEIKETDMKQQERVKQHFSVILFTIQSATSTLRETEKFV